MLHTLKAVDVFLQVIHTVSVFHVLDVQGKCMLFVQSMGQVRISAKEPEYDAFFVTFEMCLCHFISPGVYYELQLVSECDEGIEELGILLA